MRKCLDCGEELSDVAVQCSACDSENLSFIEKEDTEIKEKKSYFLLYLIGIIVVISVVAGVLVHTYFSTSLPAAPVLEGVTASAKGDMQTYIEKMYPELQTDYENAFLDTYSSYSAYSDSITDGYEKTYGNDYKVEAECIDVTDMSDVMIAALCKQYYNSLNIDLNISQAKYVTIGVKVSNEDGLESYTTQTLNSVEIDGDWYLFYDILSQSTSSDTSTND